MITFVFRVLLLVPFLLCVVPATAQFLRPYEPFDATKAQSLSLSQGSIVVQGENGSPKIYDFQFEVADTHSTRATGLMHRAELPQNRGMLFDFETDRMVSMWMRNTFIPLDMLFLSNTGEVMTIAENTVPHSEKPISSRVPVRSVLELAAGTVARLGVEVGDKVQHGMFQP
ncbi:MAG: DUF192 domain-containing protein [Rhodospirillaceae bacterium]